MMDNPARSQSARRSIEEVQVPVKPKLAPRRAMRVTTTKRVTTAKRFTTLTLDVSGRIATITLNRPGRLNAINSEMPAEIRAAVEAANDDDRVHVIVLRGAGKAFCAGYDLKAYAEGDRTHEYTQALPWDPTLDYKIMKRNTEDFMSLWRSHKPTIARVHG